MTSPAAAAFLSALLPGWGQIRAGRRTAARVFQALEAAAWLLKFVWIPFPAMSPTYGIVANVAIFALRFAGALHAVRAAGGRGLLLLALILSPVFVVAQTFALGLLLKFTCYEPFTVPSGGQEPTIMGPAGHRCDFPSRHANPEPDHILVSKLAYVFGDVQRWDTVCFRFPLNPKQRLIKRVVGMPGEELKIEAGEIWTRAPGAGAFRIARKPLESQESAWVDLDVDFDRAWETLGEFKVVDGQLRAGPGSAFKWTAVIEGEDRLFEMDVELETPGVALKIDLSNSSGTFTWRWGGDAALTHAGTLIGSPAKPRPGRAERVSLALTDGRAIAWRDGDELARMEYLSEHSQVPASTEKGGIRFAVEGGTARIRRIRVARDLVWERGWRFEGDGVVSIPAEHYFMLGDNALSSLDSRGWRRVTVTLAGGAKAHFEAQADGMTPNGIAGVDEQGRPVLLPLEAGARSEEPFRFIGKDFVEGRVYRVWWPPERARAIR